MLNPQISEIARWYDLAPEICPQAVKAWGLLEKEILAQYDRIESALDITHTVNPAPYRTAYDMIADVAQGRIKVSIANSEHPLWSLETNVKFRAVHDVIGHASTGAGFDWEGEVTAWRKHASLFESPLVKLALYTEVVGQAAGYFAHGEFGPQKCALLPQFLQWQ